MPAEQELDTRGRELLDFERAWNLHQGRKETAIRERFGISPARYYQLLARTVDDPAALEYDPLTVRRIRRRRRDQTRRRTGAALDARPPH